MTKKYHFSSNVDPKLRKEFQNKSKKLKKVFAESKSDEELIKNMEKIGFTYFDDSEQP